MAPAVRAIWVVSASGGLTYARKTLHSDPLSLPTNELLRLASLVHSLHTVCDSVAPVEHSSRTSCGLRSISSSSLTLHVLKSRTGPSFIAVCDSDAANQRSIAQQQGNAMLGQSATPMTAINATATNATRKQQQQMMMLHPLAPEEVLYRVYETYADMVLKDPFHDEDMPINNPHFDAAVGRIALSSIPS